MRSPTPAESSPEVRPQIGSHGPHWRPVLLGMVLGAITSWVVFAVLGRLLVAFWAPSRFGRTDGNLVLLADTTTVVGLTALIALGLLIGLRRCAEPLFLVACVLGGTLISSAVTAVVDRHPPGQTP